MKTIAAKKVSRFFLFSLMTSFMVLLLSSASPIQKNFTQSSSKCFYLVRHVMGGPNNPKTVPLFVPDNRLDEHLGHGDSFILPGCVTSIGDIVNDPPHGPVHP